MRAALFVDLRLSFAARSGDGLGRARDLQRRRGEHDRADFDDSRNGSPGRAGRAAGPVAPLAEAIATHGRRGKERSLGSGIGGRGCAAVRDAARLGDVARRAGAALAAGRRRILFERGLCGVWPIPCRPALPPGEIPEGRDRAERADAANPPSARLPGRSAAGSAGSARSWVGGAGAARPGTRERASIREELTRRVARALRPARPLSGAALRRWWTARVRRVLEIAVAELPFYPINSQPQASTYELPDLGDLSRSRRFARGHARLASAAEMPSPRHREKDRSACRGDNHGQLGNHRHDLSHRQSAMAAGAGQVVGTGALVGGFPPGIAVRDLRPCVAQLCSHPAVSRGVLRGAVRGRLGDVPAALRRPDRRCAPSLPSALCDDVLADGVPDPHAGRRSGIEPRALFDAVEVLLVTGAPITPGMERHLKEVTGVSRISEAAGVTEGVLAMSCAEGAVSTCRPTPATSKPSIRRRDAGRAAGARVRWCIAS